MEVVLLGLREGENSNMDIIFLYGRFVGNKNILDWLLILGDVDIGNGSDRVTGSCNTLEGGAVTVPGLVPGRRYG